MDILARAKAYYRYYESKQEMPGGFWRLLRELMTECENQRRTIVHHEQHISNLARMLELCDKPRTPDVPKTNFEPNAYDPWQKWPQRKYD